MRVSFQRFLLGPTLCAIFVATAHAQQPRVVQGQEQGIRVYWDCQASGCDFDYVRSEILFVDWVRNRQDADVHVLVTSQATGAGGREYSLNFIGLRTFAGQSDTLRFVTQPTQTSEERRQALTHRIKLGLVPYVAHTPLAQRLQITYQAPSAAQQLRAPSTKDRWNYWVFRTSASASLDGEKRSRSASVDGSFSANRITETWKTQTELEGDYSESKYDFGGGDKESIYRHNFSFGSLTVKSLTPHWSLGVTGGIGSRSYLNQRLVVRAAPALEYNVFPYSESTRRLLTVLYSVGGNYYRYDDTTIYLKLRETRPDQRLQVSMNVVQPWGSLYSSLAASSFLDNFSQQKLDGFAQINMRVFRGLSFNLSAGGSLPRNQIYLAKGDVTDIDIITRRRQLATRYSFFGHFGLSFTFGSIFNNVVNPRFRNSDTF